MIGNDLVYFPEWPRRSGSRLARFREKIYTPKEIGWIENAEDPYLMEALLWAAKEATYKAHLKISRTKSFAPKKLKALEFKRIARPDLWVEVDERQYDVKVEREDDYIYALAKDIKTDLEKETFRITGQEHASISPRYQGYPIEIEKDELGIPHGKWQGRELDLTITHDGGVRIIEWCLKDD